MVYYIFDGAPYPASRIVSGGSRDRRNLCNLGGDLRHMLNACHHKKMLSIDKRVRQDLSIFIISWSGDDHHYYYEFIVWWDRKLAHHLFAISFADLCGREERMEISRRTTDGHQDFPAIRSRHFCKSKEIRHFLIRIWADRLLFDEYVYYTVTNKYINGTIRYDSWLHTK